MGAVCCSRECFITHKPEVIMIAAEKEVAHEMNDEEASKDSLESPHLKNDKKTLQMTEKVAETSTNTCSSSEEKFLEPEKPSEPEPLNKATQPLPKPETQETVSNSLLKNNLHEEPTIQKEENHDGAYLIFSTSSSNGYLSLLWSKRQVSNGLAYVKPKPELKIPSFKYRQQKQLVSHIMDDSYSVLKGFTLFLRSILPYHETVTFYDITAYPNFSDNVWIFQHTADNHVVKVDHTSGSLSFKSVDMVMCAYSKSRAAEAMLPLCSADSVTLDDFKRKISQIDSGYESIALRQM